MKKVISVLLENEPGALSRIVGLFSHRRFNIESLAVAPTQDRTLSRLTITTLGCDHKIAQLIKSLNKFIEVIKVVDLTEKIYIERELMLLKIKVTGNRAAEIARCVNFFRGRITDIFGAVYTIFINILPGFLVPPLLRISLYTSAN